MHRCVRYCGSCSGAYPALCLCLWSRLICLHWSAAASIKSRPANTCQPTARCTMVLSFIMHGTASIISWPMTFLIMPAAAVTVAAANCKPAVYQLQYLVREWMFRLVMRQDQHEDSSPGPIQCRHISGHASVSSGTASCNFTSTALVRPRRERIAQPFEHVTVVTHEVLCSVSMLTTTVRTILTTFQLACFFTTC